MPNLTHLLFKWQVTNHQVCFKKTSRFKDSTAPKHPFVGLGPGSGLHKVPGCGEVGSPVRGSTCAGEALEDGSFGEQTAAVEIRVEKVVESLQTWQTKTTKI